MSSYVYISDDVNKFHELTILYIQQGNEWNIMDCYKIL